MITVINHYTQICIQITKENSETETYLPHVGFLIRMHKEHKMERCLE